MHLVGELMQRWPRHPLYRPLVHRDGTDAAVEAEGRLIPIQDPPLQAPVVLVDALLRKCGEQCLAVAGAPELWPDVEVFQVQAVLAQPGREVEEPQGEASEAASVGLVLDDVCEDRECCQRMKLLLELLHPQVL